MNVWKQYIQNKMLISWHKPQKMSKLLQKRNYLMLTNLFSTSYNQYRYKIYYTKHNTTTEFNYIEHSDTLAGFIYIGFGLDISLLHICEFEM